MIPLIAMLLVGLISIFWPAPKMENKSTTNNIELPSIKK